MDIASLGQLMQNRINALNDAKVRSISVGDLEQINTIDKDLMETRNTLQQLSMISNIISAAEAANTTPAQVIASGSQAIQSSAALPENPTIALAMYDLSTYASDPLYLQKITDILSFMPVLDTPQALDAYIDSEAIGSPLNGQMILSAAQQYVIDTRVLVAILELESNFGTAGVAVSTLNPGNVGNTGSSTRTYYSWQDGVAAVAYWLSRHPAAGLSMNTTIPAPSYVVPQNVVASVPESPAPQAPAPAPLPSQPELTPPSPIVTEQGTTSTPVQIIEPEPVPTSTPATSTPPIVPDSPAATSTDINFDPGMPAATTTLPAVPDAGAAASGATSLNSKAKSGNKKVATRSGIRIWNKSKPQA